MTINTQKLRRLINDSRELPWTLATSNSWRRIVDARHNSVCAPITQPDGHPDLLFFGGPGGPEAQLLIEAVNALPELLSALDAQTAEIARLTARCDARGEQIERLREAQAWQPIETAPKDGRTILLGRRNSLGNWRTMRGQWMSAEYIAEYWDDPDDAKPGWFETAVEADDLPNCWGVLPTHWMPLPAAPDALSGESKC